MARAGLATARFGSGQAVAIPAGRYDLVFEVRSPEPGYSSDIAYVAYLHFIETPAPGFAILKPGDELQTDRVLTMRADPA